MPIAIVTARTVKVTVPLDPHEIAALVVPNGQPRFVLTIRLPDRTITADLNAKAVRRAIATIAEHGADAVACMITGRLDGSRIGEAGLVVNVKASRAPALEASDAAA
jgi:hypothetical protein